MDEETQQNLINLTSQFYSSVASSFSETRQSAWRGWERVCESVELPNEFSLLDVACGNLRFEKFLLEKNLTPRVAYCYDNCEALLPEDVPDFVQFESIDLFANQVNTIADFAVCFGFMHHIPSFERRRSFLKAIVDNVNCGGYVALSFWQFMNDERIAKKAEKTTDKLNFQLEEGDYLLGWKDREGVFRYCHNFSDAEIDSLLEDFCVVDVFSEDGKAHNLNKYVVLKKL